MALKSNNLVDDLINLTSTKNNKIKYCLPSPYIGLNPVKSETNTIQDQINFGLKNQIIDLSQIKGIRKAKNMQQPQPILNTVNNGVEVDMLNSNSIEASFMHFIRSLRLFRLATHAIRKQRGMFKKYLTLAWLWAIEMEKGYFTITDLQHFRSWKSGEYSGKLMEIYLDLGFVVEMKARRIKKKQIRSFTVSTSMRSALLRGWAHSLGATDKIPGLLFPADLVRNIRIQLQMSPKEFSEFTGIGFNNLSNIEMGHKRMSQRNSARLYDKLWFMVRPQFWPASIRREVKEGKRPFYGNEITTDLAGLDSHLVVVNNAYKMFLKTMEEKAEKAKKS